MRNLYDIQSVAYLFSYITLMTYLWYFGFAWWAYLGLLFFSVGIQVVHHNHIHLGIWRNRRLNYATNLLITLISAVPSAMMVGGHLRNHHVHQHGPDDHTRTYRFGGDHNHLLGYLLHPIQAFFVLIPIFWRQFLEGLPIRSRYSRDLLVQVLLIFLSWALLLYVDWRKCALFVILPQLFGLHWLLGANYFQHAHCDDQSSENYARNFTGAVNWIWFNIGFHTAHHDQPSVHWTQLPQIHQAKCHQLEPCLNQKSFVVYVAKTFLLGPFLPGLRSRSLRRPASRG